MKQTFFLALVGYLLVLSNLNAQPLVGVRLDLYPALAAPNIIFAHDTAATNTNGINARKHGVGITGLYTIQINDNVSILPEVGIFYRPVKYQVTDLEYERHRILLQLRLLLEKSFPKRPFTIHGGFGITMNRYPPKLNNEYTFIGSDRATIDIIFGGQYKLKKIFLTGRIHSTILPFSRIIYRSSIEPEKKIEILGHGPSISIGIGCILQNRRSHG